MAVLHIPASMRSGTGGESTVEVAGDTLEEALDTLDAAYPGMHARIVESKRVRGNLAVFVDGKQVDNDLRTRLRVDSEVYFAPAIAGGSG